MYQAPPDISTHFTPQEIIGPGDYRLFVEHYKIAMITRVGEEWPEKKLKKEFEDDARVFVASVLRKLSDNGYVPNGIKSNGDIHWSVILKSQTRSEFEKEINRYLGKTLEQLKQQARAEWREMINSIEAKEV